MTFLHLLQNTSNMWSTPLPIRLALASTHSVTPYNRLLATEVTVVNVWFHAHGLELQTAHGPPDQQRCHLSLENLFEMQTLGPQPDNSDTLGWGQGSTLQQAFQAPVMCSGLRIPAPCIPEPHGST